MSDEEDPRSPEEKAVYDKIADQKELEYGAERIAIGEEAVRMADAGGFEQAAFEARLQLVQSAVLGGYPEKGFVAFAWCASKSKEEPERFRESRSLGGIFLLGVDVLWTYKWMTLQVPWYPQITRAQMDETLGDMESRYRAHNLSLRPVHMARVRCLIETGGDPDEAKEQFRKWQFATRDLYADCEACEVSFQSWYFAERGDPERAIQEAHRLLSGEKSCAEVPHNTYARLLECALELGRTEDAAKWHDVGYPMIQSNRDFVWNVSRHIAYLVRVGNLEKAQTLAERHLDWAVDNRVIDRRMWYFAALRDLFAALSGMVAVRLSPKLAVYSEDGEYSAEELRDFFDRETHAMASRFDQRNGNDYVSRRVGTRKHSNGSL